MSINISAREYDGGIIALDSGMVRREMAACYLLETQDQVALIEVGNNASVERILFILEQRGWSPAQVSHVIVTHVHLDHAGGAGKLMDLLPKAILAVHPRGARHLIDPGRLESSARAVYGDEAFDAMYGSLVPVPEERVQIMQDGDSLSVGGRELHFMDSPGHARHHFCVWDEQTRGWFTGDTFGLSYRDLDTPNGPFIFPTTTPIQFDPEALINSVGRLMEKSPEYMYLTHFGRVGDLQRLAEDMITGVHKLVEIGEKHIASTTREEDIKQDILSWLTALSRAHGVTLPDDSLLEVLDNDATLNAQGIDFWLSHRT